jgi:anti-sigma B factor antagonist
MSTTPADDIPRFQISSERASGDLVVLRIAGELDISHEDEVRGKLREAVADAERGIVIDLTDCEFIDSSGVRALLLGHEAQPHRLAVASDSDQIRRILSLMGVDKAIPVQPTVQAAIAELPDGD